MHRNDHPSAPGGLHTDGDPSRGIAPTTVTAALMNALQEELANFIESRGIALDKGDNTQLTQAIASAITTTVISGDFVTRPEFRVHTDAADPHQQYALESMLGDAARMDIGTTGGSVAAGNHEHSQYELKTNLKQAAYRDVGTGADQVAAGNHTHGELGSSYVPYIAGKALSFGTNYTMAQITIPASGAARAARVTLPVFSADTDGEGGEPGLTCYIRINGADNVSNLIWVKNDRYGNGLLYSWTPMLTFLVPAGVTKLTIEVRVDLFGTMKNPRHDSGYVWVDLK
ncbi:hypothetical protein NM74_07795 [Aeromonas hydrophila]|uniref:hypothetical protein n=1 Tax=Aeromonas hydrophila TaxID=644 RepID=UPI000537C66B|nr:hypothetical protein [Aeromonas hydrophila]KHA57119.1 hypothetical protein NM74_07795 [Aeromonas hydrophila]